MKNILLFLFLFLPLLSHAADKSSLVITFSDNTTQTVALSTLPDIWMKDDKMTVKTSETTLEYPLYTVKTFTFGNATGIKAVKTTEYQLTGDALILPDESAAVRVYTLDGKAVSCPVEHGYSQTVVSLTSLQPGAYIIQAGGRSVKIMR
jgi:hypothetical protein